MKRSSVANDNDYTNVEPAEKSVRKLEEDEIYYEVLELRLKVIKLEKDYQSACRVSNEYEKQLKEYKDRVESLENLLDAKPVMTSSEEANELMRQLCATRTSLEDSEQANRDLHLKVYMLTRKVEQLQSVNLSKIATASENVDEMTRKLVEYEKSQLQNPLDTNQMATELSMTMFGLEETSRKNEELKRKINDLTHENEDLRKVADQADSLKSKNKTKELMLHLRKTKKELIVSKQSNRKLQIQVYALTNDAVNEVTNELKEKLSMTKFQLGEERRKKGELESINNMLTRKNDELRKANEAAYQKYVNKYMITLNKTRNELKKSKLVNDDLQLEVVELRRKLAESGQSPKVELRNESNVASIANIFMLCPWEAPGTMLFGNAVRLLQNAYFPSDLAWKAKFKQAVKANILTCNLCADLRFAPIFRGAAILEHFFTSSHTKKIRDQHGTVSLAAFNYWMDKLNEISKPIPLEPPPKPQLPKRAQPPTVTFRRKSTVMMLDEDVPD